MNYEIDENGCWIWQGAVSSRGYGSMKVNGSSISAHRHAYEQARGAIPPDMLVRHTCDVKLCVNPNHLLLGTQAENMADARERGRLNPNYDNRRKLSREDAKEIRLMLEAGYTHPHIAEKFGVTKENIHLIGKRKTHRDYESIPSADEVTAYVKKHGEDAKQQRASCYHRDPETTSKLTAIEVREIHLLYHIGVSVGVLAKRYGVTSTSVSNIVQGKAWLNVVVSYQDKAAFSECVDHCLTREDRS